MRLIEHSLDNTELHVLEKDLEIQLPKSFKEVISKFNLGNFTINNFEFGYQTNYLTKLKELNLAVNYNQWWQGDDRPKNIIAIAISDPYTILLDCKEGYIYALLSDDNWKDWRVASNDFIVFLRSISTLYINFLEKKDNSDLLMKIISINDASDEEFWNTLV